MAGVIPVEVADQLPARLTASFNPITSAAKAILNERWAEIPAESQDSFTHALQDTISFRIGSVQEMIDFEQSYIRFDIQNTTTGQQTIATTNSNPYLFDVGGLHSLFREIVIKTVNGEVELERIEHYNKYVAMKSLLMDDADMVEQQGSLEYDDLGEYHVFGEKASWRVSEGITGWLALGGGAPLVGESHIRLNSSDRGYLAPGDTFTITNAVDIGLRIFTITDVRVITGAAAGFTLDTFIRFTPILLAGEVDGASLDLLVTQKGGRRSRRGLISDSFRGNTVSTFTHTVMFKPRMELWKQFFPLMFINGGLRLNLLLENPNRVFYTRNTINNLGVNAYNYTISNVRFVGRYVTLHSSIRNELRRQFDSEKGIDLMINAVRPRIVSQANTTQGTSYAIFPGLRSVRAMVIVFMDSGMSDGATAATRSNPSLSGMLSGLLTEIFVSAGSLRFPDTPIVVDDEGKEVMKHAMILANRMKGTHHIKHRFSEVQWRPEFNYNTTALVVVPETRHRMYAFDFSRADGMDGFLTGLDTTSTEMIIHLTRGGQFADYAARGFLTSTHIYHWLFYDQITTLGRNGVTVSL